ncbi:MAG: iron-only hydrogenase system regulator [Lachnospiraceae bacterium]|nr:iron-only hydrogenase system regulator [Lachnospiraceae bacterium]MBR5897258.1 iron-only hydrogenase system regulator [Lachnospiraceae bacterium]
METRVAIIGIIVENDDAVPKIQEQLTKYSEYIIGRMGIPYCKRDIKIISVAIDAPMDKINALTGKIGRLEGVSAKAVYQKSID